MSQLCCDIALFGKRPSPYYVKCSAKKQRETTVSLRHEGQSMRKTSITLNVSSSAVAKPIKHYDETGSHEDRHRKGRPRVASAAEVKYIGVSTLRNRRLTSPQLAVSLNSTCKTPVSTSTVKRRLRDTGLLGRVPLSSVCVLLPILIIYFYWPAFATLPRRPASQSRIFTVDVETGVLRVHIYALYKIFSFLAISHME